MLESTNRKTVQIAGAEINRSCHACAFFHTREEYYEVLLPFIQDGFKAGDKTLHIVDANLHTDHLNRLKQTQLPIDDLLHSKEFVLKGWGESYLKPGHFSQDAMLEMVEEVLVEARTEGFPMARLVGNMEWACDHDIPGVKDIVKYEARLNIFLSNYDAVLVCCYELPKHSATVIMDIMRTHPYVLIGGTLHENPYYVTPAELLSELEERDTAIG